MQDKESKDSFSFKCVFAVVVYALAIVVLKIFTKDEFKMMPAGDKIVKFLEKLKIY